MKESKKQKNKKQIDKNAQNKNGSNVNEVWIHTKKQTRSVISQLLFNGTKQI